jgi:hypothetical protein
MRFEIPKAIGSFSDDVLGPPEYWKHSKHHELGTIDELSTFLSEILDDPDF